MKMSRLYTKSKKISVALVKTLFTWDMTFNNLSCGMVTSDYLDNSFKCLENNLTIIGF